MHKQASSDHLLRILPYHSLSSHMSNKVVMTYFFRAFHFNVDVIQFGGGLILKSLFLFLVFEVTDTNSVQPHINDIRLGEKKSFIT